MSGLKIGKVFGIPLILHISCVVLLVLIILSFRAVFSNILANLPTWHYWLMAGAGGLLFLGSLVGHELAHSLVAKRNGISVESITLFAFGGAARLKKELEDPGAEFRMAAAGPISSFVFAGIFLGASHILSSAGFSQGAVVAGHLFLLNIILGAFNLIPAFPLDGGRIFRAGLWRVLNNAVSATKIAAAIGEFFGRMMVIFGVLSLFQGNVVFGLWFGFIGWFLAQAAKGSETHFLVQKALAAKIVAEINITDLRELAPEEIKMYQKRGWVCRPQDDLFAVFSIMQTKKAALFLVEDGREIRGIIYKDDIFDAIEKEWKKWKKR